MGERNIRKLPFPDLRDDLPPQDGRLQDVGLVHRSHLPVPLAGQLESDPGDPLDLRAGVHFRVDPRLDAVDHLHSPGLPEVDPPGELPHDDEIDPLHELPPQGRGVQKRPVHLGGPKIREEPEGLPQAQEAALRPDLERKRVPLRPSDGAQEHGVGGLRQGECPVGQRNTVDVVGRAPQELLLGLEPSLSRDLLDRPEDGQRLPDDFGADPVAGEHADLGHERYFPFRRAAM